MTHLTIISAGIALALAPLALAQETQPAAPAAPAMTAQSASPDAPGQRPDWRAQRGERQGWRGQGFSADAMLQRLDTNGDGIVEISELGDNPRAQRWAQADTNGDGILASGEITVVMEQWRAQRGERQGRRGPGTQAASATPES